MKPNANKLIFPSVVLAAASVMTAYLQTPIPALLVSFLVFVLLLVQLAASRRVQSAAVVPPEFQAKLASLEHQGGRSAKELLLAQAEVELLKGEIRDLEQKEASLKAQNQSYEALVQKLQAAPVDDSQAVVQFVRNLQSRGRFLDFIMADIHKLPDQQVGAVSRVVHQGLRELMEDYFAIKPIAADAEGDMIAVPQDELGKSWSLIGSRGETIPTRGRLLHRGWQASRMKLPQSQKQETTAERLILASAEVDVESIGAGSEGR